MSNIDWVEISKQIPGIIFGLIVGLIVGITVSYFTHILTQRREKEKYKPSILLMCNLLPDFQPKDFYILAINTGLSPITIVEAGIKFSDGSSSTYTFWELPKRLESGEIAKYNASISSLWQTMLEDGVDLVAVWIREAKGQTFELTIPEQIKIGIEAEFA